MSFEKKIAAIVVTAGLGLSGTAFAAECALPAKVPTVPDGATATEAQMIEGSKAVKAYMAENNAYLGCLDQASSAAIAVTADDKKAAVKKTYDTKYDAAVAVQEELAAKFNGALRAYKERSGK